MATTTPSPLALSIRARLAWLLDSDRSGPCPAATPRSEQS